MSAGKEAGDCEGAGGGGGVCFWISCGAFAAELELIADRLMVLTSGGSIGKCRGNHQWVNEFFLKTKVREVVAACLA